MTLLSCPFFFSPLTPYSSGTASCCPADFATSATSSASADALARDHFVFARYLAVPVPDPSNVFFGPMAETRSPISYEPKDLTEENNSILVKPMLFHRPSTDVEHGDSPLLNRIWMMSKYGICWLHRCACKREKQVLTDLQRKLCVKLITFPRKYRETCPQCSHTEESRVKKHFSTEKAFPRDLNQFEEKTKLSSGSLIRKKPARLALEEQRDHLLAEAKSEILKQ